jgi:hypothetical protein
MVEVGQDTRRRVRYRASGNVSLGRTVKKGGEDYRQRPVDLKRR